MSKYADDSAIEAEEERKLKPCPFCGGEADLMQSTSTLGYISHHWSVNCTVEGCCETGWLESESEAEAAWNRRSGDEKHCRKMWREANKSTVEKENQFHTLLDAVREVRDEALSSDRYDPDSMGNICNALTRIIDDAEKQSVTKQVGTGPSTKAVTITPDE
jgi:hypothetical protein